MHFTGTVYRAPIDAYVPLIEITQGCTHNKCKFCNMYKEVPFRMSPMEWIEEDLQELKETVPNTTKLAFVGANPFVLSYDKMRNILEKVHQYLPKVTYISMAARVTDIKNKSVEELIELRKLGVARIYVGVESGDDWTLNRINKGYKSEDIIEQCSKLDKAGIPYWMTFLNGVSDVEHSRDHAINSAKIFNQLKPEVVGSGSLVLFPDLELTKEVEKGEFTQLNEKQMMEEYRLFLENLNVDCRLENHAYTSVLPVSGKFLENKQELLDTLDSAIEHYDEEKEYREARRRNISSL